MTDFDCELPPGVRAELLAPRRARMLGRPPAPPRKRSWLDRARSIGRVAALGFLGLVFLMALAAIVSWSTSKHAPTPAKASMPTPTSAVVQPTPASTPSGAVPTPAPRAQLILFPAPRAQLVRLPSARVDLFAIAPEHIDQTHTITMPYGTEVSATLRGFLEQESQLPRVGHIGDMFVVGGTPWIFTQVPGTSAPTWVDP